MSGRPIRLGSTVASGRHGERQTLDWWVIGRWEPRDRERVVSGPYTRDGARETIAWLKKRGERNQADRWSSLRVGKTLKNE